MLNNLLYISIKYIILYFFDFTVNNMFFIYIYYVYLLFIFIVYIRNIYID